MKRMTSSILLLLILSVSGFGQYATIPMNARILPLGVRGTSYADAEAGTQGGTLYVARNEPPTSWNAITASDPGTLWFTRRMCRGLLAYDPMLDAIVPDLARAFEVSQDGLRVMVHLRQGICWSDGEEVTADDVAFTFNALILNEDVDCPLREGMRLADDSSYLRCETVDRHTVLFSVSSAFRSILYALTFPVMPCHSLASSVHSVNADVAVGTFNETWNLETPLDALVVSGPYRIVEYEPGTAVIMERNPYYYTYDLMGTQLPYYDRLVVSLDTSDDATMLKFKAGEIDVCDVEPEWVDALAAEAQARGFSMIATDEPTYEIEWLVINQDIRIQKDADGAKRDLYRDVRFRQALARLIDTSAMISDVLLGYGNPLWSPVGIPSPFYGGRDYYAGPIREREVVQHDYDPIRAAAALDDLGVIDQDGDGWRDLPNGEALEITMATNDSATRVACCRIIEAAFRSAGLNVRLEVCGYAALVERLLLGDVDCVQLSFVGGPEPNTYRAIYGPHGVQHFWRLSSSVAPTAVDREIDRLLVQAAETYDLAEAFTYALEFQRTAAVDVPLIYLPQKSFLYGYYDYVGNADLASPLFSPIGYGGLMTEICFDRRL